MRNEPLIGRLIETVAALATAESVHSIKQGTSKRGASPLW